MAAVGYKLLVLEPEHRLGERPVDKLAEDPALARAGARPASQTSDLGTPGQAGASVREDRSDPDS